MEYFKVKDKAIGGDVYYIAFTSNNLAVNMTGKADIVKAIYHLDISGETFYTIDINYDSPFDLNIIDIEYELDQTDWNYLKNMSDDDVKMSANFNDFDPLVDKTISLYGYLFPIKSLKQKIKNIEEE